MMCKRAVFVRHRLMTGGHVDDAQAPVAQADVAIDEDSFLVRSAMRDDVAHRLQHGL